MPRVWLLAIGAGALIIGVWHGATYKSYPAGLPASVVSDLRARGCDLLPQHSVVQSAEFTAVLCRIGGEASLLIYTRGQAKAIQLNKHPGGLDEKNPEAARGIRLVHWDYVARHNPGLSTAGHPQTCVEDGVGMGSALYCNLDGAWVGLAGAD